MKQSKISLWPTKELAVVITLFIVVALAAGIAVIVRLSAKSTINSFSDCAKAGNPVTSSYPEQCIANGRTFINPDFDPSKVILPAN